MAKRPAFAILSLLLIWIPVRTRAQAPAPATIAEKVKDAQKLPGYFNLYWDVKQGKLWLEIDKWNTEFLYQSSLPAGCGSNGAGRRFCWFRRIWIFARLRMTRANGARYTIRLRSRSCGVLPWLPKRIRVCLWMRQISFCATHMA